MPSRFKLSQASENTARPISSENLTLGTSETATAARLTKKVDVSNSRTDKLELHLKFTNHAAMSADKVYVKFRTSIVDQPTMNTLADWAHIQIDRLHPTTGEAEVLDLKYTIDTSDNTCTNYVLNVPCVGQWMSAVIWCDAAGTAPAVTATWMRSS